MFLSSKVELFVSHRYLQQVRTSFSIRHQLDCNLIKKVIYYGRAFALQVTNYVQRSLESHKQNHHSEEAILD